jgi:sulfonate transport system permease protein
MAGLRIAGPIALLGAIFAEFGGGVRWGLGSYLLASLARAQPERIWGIALVTTAIGATVYGLFSWLGARFTRTNISATVAASTTPALLTTTANEPLWKRASYACASACIVLALWAGTLKLLGISPIVARSPLSVARYLTTGPRAGDARDRLFAALRETLPLALLGLLCGLAAAFLLAVLLRLRPPLARAVLPFALVTQTMPLVALTPIIVLVFGRDVLATVIVCVAVTFFPSFVIIAQALASTPPATADVVRGYGGHDGAVLRYVGLPSAIPALVTAARLATPRALLGVMVAEYLATGKGLGFLLSQSRGLIDYGMIWSVAAVSVLIAVALTQLLGIIERRVHRSFVGMTK